MSYHKTEFNRLNQEFQNAVSLLLNSSNSTTSQLEYVLDSYNALVVYSEIDYERKKKTTKEYIIDTLEVNRISIQRCFEKLNIPLILPGKLLSTIHYIIQSNQMSNENTNTDTGSQSNSTNNSGQNSNSPSNSNENSNNHTQNNSNSDSTMEQSIDKFIKYTGNILNYKYGGDPLELNSFIADAKMLYDLAKNDETKTFAFNYIKNRLKGRAAETIPDNCNTIDGLVDALKEKIKPDTSGIIEGRILTLNLKNNDYSKFSAEAEKLSEALRRTLVIEGITKAKAEEIAINKMVDLCRKTTKYEIVKSVLEASTFKTPADVLAKFITQSDKARQDQREQQLKNANKSNSNNGNDNKRGKRYNNNYRNGGNNQNNNRSNNQNGFRANRGQNQQQNRGRNNYSNRPNRGEQTIRVIAGSNDTAPVEQSATPQQQQPQQFFRLEN